MNSTAILAFTGSLIGLFLLAAFVGWLKFGSAMFLSMAETGLSWCF